MSLILIVFWGIISIWFLFLVGFTLLMTINIGFYDSFLQSWWMFVLSTLFLIIAVNHFTFIKYLEKNKPKLIRSLLLERKSFKSLLSKSPTAMKLHPIEFISYCSNLKDEKDKRIRIQKIIYVLSSSLFVALFFAVGIYFWLRSY